jgi:hypothetical protein
MQYALLAFGGQRTHAGPVEGAIAAGPFIETKEYLAGVIVVEADNLDAALAIAQELQDTRTSGAIEVRPIVEALFHGA